MSSIPGGGKGSRKNDICAIYEANKDSNDTNPAMVLKRVPTLESIDCKPVTNEVKRKAESME